MTKVMKSNTTDTGLVEQPGERFGVIAVIKGRAKGLANTSLLSAHAGHRFISACCRSRCASNEAMRGLGRLTVRTLRAVLSPVKHTDSLLLRRRASCRTTERRPVTKSRSDHQSPRTSPWRRPKDNPSAHRASSRSPLAALKSCRASRIVSGSTKKRGTFGGSTSSATFRLTTPTEPPRLTLAAASHGSVERCWVTDHS